MEECFDMGLGNSHIANFPHILILAELLMGLRERAVCILQPPEMHIQQCLKICMFYANYIALHIHNVQLFKRRDGRKGEKDSSSQELKSINCNFPATNKTGPSNYVFLCVFLNAVAM